MTFLLSHPAYLARLAFVAHFVFVFGGLLVYAVGTHMSGQRRHPSAALAWVLSIALMPYVGLPLYLMLGTRKITRPARRAPTSPCAVLEHGLRATAMATLSGMGLGSPAVALKLKFHEDGRAAWDGLTALVLSAQARLDICTFVLGNDMLGERVVQLLQERARAGVRVRVLLDAVGSWQTSFAQVRRLRSAGVQVQWYMPLLHNPFRGRANLRNHRKLALADGLRLWSGGRNLAAEYFTGSDGEPPWIDLSFTLEGPLAVQAQALFCSHWTGSADDDMPSGTASTVPAEAPPPHLAHLAQLVPSGPDQIEDTFYGLLLTSVFRAQRRVLAVTPYFVPDDSLLTALCLAARRGVRVELVMPARSNHRLADLARARALRDLVAAGGIVRLATGMVHAKAVVIDDAMALCGSLNLDSRSLFLNFELMVAFYDREDVFTLTQWIDRHFGALPDFAPRQPSLPRDIVEGLVRWLGFQI